MLIKILSEENGVYNVRCSCGEVFYSEKFDEALRCKKCREKNKELKNDRKIFEKEINEQLEQIIYNLCEEYTDE